MAANVPPGSFYVGLGVVGLSLLVATMGWFFTRNKWVPSTLTLASASSGIFLLLEDRPLYYLGVYHWYGLLVESVLDLGAFVSILKGRFSFPVAVNLLVFLSVVLDAALGLPFSTLQGAVPYVGWQILYGFGPTRPEIEWSAAVSILTVTSLGAALSALRQRFLETKTRV
ncbi:hypothetical protein HS1genome_1595 [Sulfodiicoccus acidiphilus]|uniref:Uncharacterized protein n=1 Tax=Sulfodiicoccus acidiphilus TaxID=1670455 RepID=A0A348B4V4_9CREN|nr:hypothetical protein [Sulfodiicoccus acidiphilus]BBD73206.1 hypothetical protein HS1genome_1595 [Sulfodiicoccus acidiphilus]GGU04926.1 hypothetical protein GCM10007116_21910 [Sulfodiicoccus acidiphilus]